MPVIKVSRLLLGKTFYAINICGLIFTRGWLAPAEHNHERIHTRQQCEMLFVFFFVWYLLEWLVRLVMYRDLVRAYRNISFEREAYRHQHDLTYLKHRHLFAWRRHLK